MAEHGVIYTRLMNSSEWRQIRQRVMAKQVWCQECIKHGVVRAGEVVHHIVEVETGRTESEQRELAFNENNCLVLCKRCHNKLHADMKSHSRKVHQERNEARLASWIARQKGHADSE